MARILLATDGSPSAEAATREAVELAGATGWPLTILTVWRIPVTGFAYEPLVSVPEVAEAVQERARLALETAAATARAAGLEPDARLVEGLPAHDICEVARERDASVIVIGSHGWGTVQRLLFGSVSGAVLHHAPCPVLVVRGETPPGGATTA
jgi:nucleotide-binding universal stress UspA family protein